MKPSIIEKRNAKQDIKINAILDNRKPLANPNFFLPCLVEEKPKKHYYKGKVEPLYRIAFMKEHSRNLEKGERLINICCTANCSEPSHYITNKTLKSFFKDILIIEGEEDEEGIQSLNGFFRDYQF